MENWFSFARVAPWLLLGAVACDSFKEKPPAPYLVEVTVESDPGKRVEGAKVFLGANEVAATHADGKAVLKLHGEEGESLTFHVKCPEGHQSPGPLSVTLRRMANPKKFPVYQVSCPPLTRTTVVAIRADNGPNLPVLFLGREVARTDASGAAHVSLSLRPEEAFQLMLKTSGSEQGERLRPKDPVATFRVKHHDDVVTFDQVFKVERRIRHWHRRTGPTRLDAH